MVAQVSCISIPNCGAPLSHRFRMSLHSKHQVCPWICFPNPSPDLHQCAHISGWGMQGYGLDNLCVSHSILLATDQFLCSPPSPWRAASVLADILLVTGLPQMWEVLVSFNYPQGTDPLPFLLFFTPSFFCPLQLCRDFLVLLNVQRPLLFWNWK